LWQSKNKLQKQTRSPRFAPTSQELKPTSNSVKPPMAYIHYRNVVAAEPCSEHSCRLAASDNVIVFYTEQTTPAFGHPSKEGNFGEVLQIQNLSATVATHRILRLMFTTTAAISKR